MLGTLLWLTLAQADCPSLDARIPPLTQRRLLGWLGPTQAELDARHSGYDCDGWTALMRAADVGDLASVEALLHQGADPAISIRTGLGGEPTDARCLALARGRPDVVAALDRARAPRLGCTSTALLFGARPGLVHARDRDQFLAEEVVRRAFGVRTLQRAVASFGTRDSTALFLEAIAAGDAGRVGDYQHAGLTVRGPEPFVAAVRASLFHALRPLFAAGTRLTDRAITDAVWGAMQRDDDRIVCEVVDLGWRGGPDVPAVLWAMQAGWDRVPRLIDADFDLEAEDPSGTTALLYATRRRNAAWVKQLLARGSNPAHGNVLCETPFDAAQGTRLAPLFPKRRAPVVGAAAKRRGVGCGSAELILPYLDGAEAWLDGAPEPLRTGLTYRVDPGRHVLRLRAAWGEEAEWTVGVRLFPGSNALDAFSFQRPGRGTEDRAPR